MEPFDIHKSLSNIYFPAPSGNVKKDSQQNDQQIRDPITGDVLSFNNEHRLGSALVLRTTQLPQKKPWHARGWLTFLLLIIMVPYYKLLSSQTANTLVDYLQNLGYAVPHEYFETTGSSFLGMASSTNRFWAGWARNGWWQIPVTLGVGIGVGPDPIVQFMVTAVFRIWAGLASFSNALYFTIKMTFSRLISSLLEILGVDEYLAAMISGGLSLMLISSIIYFLPSIYKFLKSKEKKSLKPGFLNNSAFYWFERRVLRNYEPPVRTERKERVENVQ